MRRRTLVLLVAIALSCLAVPPAGAATSARLASTLGAVWETTLETPTPTNPFTGGDPCVALPDGIVAPFGPSGADSCTVSRGTKIFVVAWSVECSTFEGNGTTDAELRRCALAADSGVTHVAVSVDGRPVEVTRVQTGLLAIHLPKDNIFGVSGAARNGLSVGDGWVALLDALARGTHTIVIDHEGSGLPQVTTRIVVT